MNVERERLWDEGREIVLAAPALYIDVDVEADGIAGFGSMLSIGAQSPTGESFYSEIKPHSDVYLPGNKDFCEAHGLQRERLIREAPELAVVMGGFERWLKDLNDMYEKPLVLTAFNAGFDWAHVDLSFVLAGCDKNPFGIASFDLKSLALPLSTQWDFGKTSKSKLPSQIIPEGTFTHNALEDAQYQQKLHFGMAALLGRTGYMAAAESQRKLEALSGREA